ncbi:MAG: nucleoside triphosphate pyrophosphohydrolase [Dehalococcoidia bacterium]|nr:nucleoside triphosphate pyrophosphohydrolase [Dehalococcoidia bacterium]
MDSFDTLVDIIARLRSPDGCPWDREQTQLSIKSNLTEEAYEVLEAIDEGDMGKLCEELGDLLMQIVLHAQMAREEGDFEIGDVIRGINSKLIRRHPHVFGDADAKDAQQVIANWEALKREEGKGSLLTGIPKEMPALAYSQAMQRRVARVGFDWEDVEGIIEKLSEEVAELKETTEHRKRVREFGDLLFTLANIARRLEIDLEAALRGANERFYHRFSYMEQLCQERGIQLSSLSFDEQNALWEEAKKQIGG